jgi:hypothetical protein
MADDKKVEGRTAYIKKNMPDGALKSILVKGSELVDDIGFTQQKEYEGKTREEIAKKPTPEKKRAGGTVGSASKRADGVAMRGKTRGRMV